MTKEGYGTTRFAGRQQAAHRVAWQLAGLELPPRGLGVAQSCGNRRCVAREHLVVQRNGSHNREKQWCVNGHELSGENVRVTKAGGRLCRACARERTAKARRATAFGQAKLAALERAGYRCERCNAADDQLHGHHRDRDKEHNEMENIEILCDACHGREHWDEKQRGVREGLRRWAASPSAVEVA